ncbi:MAG: hypothetical protein ACOX5R_16350 [bacterium]|jgi:neutral ceramidase
MSLKSLLLTLAVITCCSQFTFSEEGSRPAAVFKAGYAEVNITPATGITMPGYFTERRATGVLDPLLSKTLVLSLNNTTLAIIALDLIGVEAPMVQKIREEVERWTGIEEHHIFVHATHTHTGATVSEIAHQLPKQVAESVKQALDRMAPVQTLKHGVSQENNIAFIRRYLMKDGTVRTNPGTGNPEIVRPIGEIDPNVHVISFEGIKTLLVSYNLHPDCIGGTQFSADFPYHMTRMIKEKMGQDWNVIYLNACCGNINHIDVKNPDQLRGYEGSRHIGHKLAQSALRALDTAREIDSATLCVKSRLVPTDVRPVPDEMLQWAKLQMEQNPQEAGTRKFNEQTPALILKLAERKGQSVPMEVMAVRIGGLALVGLPAEVFTEVAQDIKLHSLMDPVLVIGTTNGYAGYVPHHRGYAEGGYEATYGSARWCPQTPIRWSEAAISLVNELSGM